MSDQGNHSEQLPSSPDEEPTEYEVEVNIRQVEPQDENAVLLLIYDGIFVSTLNKVILNNMERPYLLCIIGFLAIAVNWLSGGLIFSLIISVICVPVVIYLTVRYLFLFIYKSLNLKDVQTGIYKYWTSTDSDRHLWVAECSGHIVGCIAIEAVSAVVVEISRLCVGEEWQCMGVGGRLADFAMEKVKQRQFKEVVTSAYNVNSESTNLFNKLGFTKVSSRKVLLGASVEEVYSIKLGSRSARNSCADLQSQTNRNSQGR